MIGILVLLVPLIVYLVGAFSVRRKDITHPDDFFVAFRRVDKTAFSSSSIAYAFQVSTIYPFLLWGASKFYFVPLVNTICWGLGILFFYLSYNRYKSFIGKDITLHGFLGEYYGKSVRIVASYLTIIAFLGLAISETYFGSKVLLSIIDSKILFYGLVFGSILFVYSYITYGGQISSFRTDQLQLIISYIGIFGLIIYFSYLIIINGISISETLSFSFLLLSVYALVILKFRKFQFIKLNEKDSKADKFINTILNIIVSAFFVIVILTSTYILFTSKIIEENDVFNNFFDIEGFGIAGLLSLIILPLCFQFVDLSNWQRLLSVKASNDNSDNLDKRIKKGLLTYALESPFTWLVFIFFGLLATTALPNLSLNDLLIDIPKEMINSGNILEEVLGFTFIVSVLAIMFSTVDSFIMGIIFTYVYDSNSKTREILDHKDKNIARAKYKEVTKIGKIFGLLILLSGLTLFVIFDNTVLDGGEMFINLLLAFYTAQISLFPFVFGILYLKKLPPASWANMSMILSTGVGIAIGIYSVIARPDLAWYPIIVCFSLSSFLYFLGIVLHKK